LRLTAIIVAAGNSLRMGGGMTKALLPLVGRPVLAHVLEMWQGFAEKMIVVVRPEDWPAAQKLIAPYGPNARLAKGGETRAASVAQALAVLQQEGGAPEWIAVHDAARPLTARSDIERVIEEATKKGAAILAAPLNDTVRWQAGGDCGELLSRELLLNAQTPQIFCGAWLISAYAAADPAALAAATDDAALVMAVGYPCAYIWAEHANLKLTRPEDLALAEAIIKMRANIND